MLEPQNWPAERFLPGHKTQGFGSVGVTNPPRHCGSGFWLGNDRNQTKLLAKNRTAGGLPGPVANTTVMELVIQYLHPAEGRPNDDWNTKSVYLVAMTILVKGSQSTTLEHGCHLRFLVPSSRPSKEFEVWVVGQGKILESSKRYKDASRRCF